MKQYLRVRQSVKTMLMKRLITFSMEGIKNADGLIFGKAFKGKPRPMIDVIEEENRVVVEGAFVKSIDKDGNADCFY